jgi:hypothetical protein
MAYDDCFDMFKQIVSYGWIAIAATKYPDGTQPTFQLESSIAVPLFIAASKCRDHRLRHEALALLRQAPKLQGLCKSAGYVLGAAKLIELEERRYIAASTMNQSLLEQGQTLPEEFRVRHSVVQPRFDSAGNMELFLYFTRRQQDQNGTWQTVEEVVPI